jgi:hypothetical protein
LKLLPRLLAEEDELNRVDWESKPVFLLCHRYWGADPGHLLVDEPLFLYEVSLGGAIGEAYNRPEYRGCVLNMPGDEPTLL